MKMPVRKAEGPKPKPANDNSNLRDRFLAARIGWRETLFGAIGWGAAMALSAQLSIWLSTAHLTAHYWSLTALAFAGAALAWPPGLAVFRFVVFGRPRQAAFAAAFLCLTILTLGITAMIFVVSYRSYYAQWHADPFTRTWIYQFVFTTASALYQFAVLGLRLYLPLGVAFLAATSLLLARSHKPQKPFKTNPLA